MYEFLLRLTPVNVGTALHRGIVGHDYLDKFYSMLKEGATVEDASSKVLEEFSLAIADKFVTGGDIAVENALADTLTSYFDQVSTLDANWEILAVEQDFQAEFDGVPVAGRLDLLVRDKTTRDLVIVDHKFSYQSWSDNDVLINGQPYKYMALLRANGIKVSRMVYNIIKYRAKTYSELVSRKPLVATVAEQDTAMRDHVFIAKEIMHARDLMDETDYRDTAPRVLNKYSCNFCSFLTICKAEMSGRTSATEKMLALDYQDNDYGYENASEQ
jgi:CRISPR/Cas system-associated exonuclease Cas4 (RecB family)